MIGSSLKNNSMRYCNVLLEGLMENYFLPEYVISNSSITCGSLTWKICASPFKPTKTACVEMVLLEFSNHKTSEFNLYVLEFMDKDEKPLYFMIQGNKIHKFMRAITGFKKLII